MTGAVLSVCSSPRHGFSKQPQASIRLLSGRGVEGDAHCGETVQHLYLKRKNPQAPNRTQVHLLQSELFEDLLPNGFELYPGQLGENITTQGIDLLRLPLGARLRLGADAVVELTGLRTPCSKIDRFQAGLLKQVAPRMGNSVLMKAGVMGVVLETGVIVPHDPVHIWLPDQRTPLGPI